MSVAPAAAPPASKVRVHLDSLTGVGINLLNMWGALLTCGAYYFWGRARALSQFYGQIEYEGDRLVFTGTGREFMRGWCVVAGLFLAYAVLNTLIAFNDPTELGLWTTAFLYAFLLAVSPMASVGVRRFRYARTTWRGVPFSFRGTTWGYAKVFVPYVVLAVLSCGVLYPVFAARTQAYLTNHTYFGDTPFRYDGTGMDMVVEHVVSMFLTVFTLGLWWNMIQARTTNYHWAHTTFGDLRFESRLTGGGLVVLHAVNAGLFILSAGIAWPLIRNLSLDYRLGCLTIVGTQDWTAVTRAATAGDGGNEAMHDSLGSSSFDVGLG